MAEDQAPREFGGAIDLEPRRRSTAQHGSEHYSTRDAAAVLGTSERTLRRAIESGDLTAVREGWSYRIARDELDRYAAAMTGRAAPHSPVRIVAFPGSADAPSLPEPLSSLIGRDEEVARVVALLADPAVRLLTLTGPGGIGKTRLALAAAAQAADTFPDGVAFVALDTVHDPDQVVPTIAQAIGLRERGDKGRAEQLQAFLREKQFLLVLDNFEQILAAGPEIAGLLAASRTVKALVTSRAPLRVQGEQELPVPPLRVTGVGDRASESPSPASSAPRPPIPDTHVSPAVQLFVARARTHAPAFVLEEDAAPLIADVCARLDGLPLAIELAAARIKVLPPRQLHARLERRLPVLTHGARNAPARHSTMRDTIAWSYDLLTAEEQALFRRLAVFAGGFSLDAVEAISSHQLSAIGRDQSIPDPPSPDPLDLVSTLVDQNLLVSEVGLDGETPRSSRGGRGGEPRFRMLETIREFGLERLAEAGELDHARAWHARHVLAIARELRPQASVHAMQAPVDRLAAEHANLLEALDWLEARGPAADFTGLAAALGGFWFACSHFREAQAWLDRALAHVDAAGAGDRVKLYLGYAAALIGQGEFARGESFLAQALPLIDGDPLDDAWAHILHGTVLVRAGRSSEAEAAFRHAQAQVDRIEDPVLRAAVAWRSIGNLGVSARERGDPAGAEAYFAEALRLCDGLGLEFAESIATMDMGATAYDRGDYALAVERWLAGIALMGERGDMRQVADALSGIGRVAAAWEAPRAALLLLGAADALRVRTGTAMLWETDIAAVERSLTTLRNILGEQRVTTTLAEGRALHLAEALAVAAEVVQTPAPDSAGDRSPDALTRREHEVLQLLAAHQTDREIAVALFLSPRTVTWHVRSIVAKLGASSRREAIARARADGLV